MIGLLSTASPVARGIRPDRLLVLVATGMHRPQGQAGGGLEEGAGSQEEEDSTIASASANRSGVPTSSQE